MKYWMIMDKKDPTRNALVGPGTKAQAIARFEAERLTVNEVKAGLTIIKIIKDGVEFMELGAPVVPTEENIPQ